MGRTLHLGATCAEGTPCFIVIYFCVRTKQKSMELGQGVVIAEEGLLAAIPVLGDMMGAARGSNSCESCHGEGRAARILKDQR
jgi:hypothetical protein